jgi:DNA-binding GntR family transcriptional regulator
LNSLILDSELASDLEDGPGSLTLGTQVYRFVRRRILEGHLMPGTKLTLRGLADELEISMQPVREAVNRLTAEATLEAPSTRVVQVPRLQKATIDELWRVRIVLEGQIAGFFARNATETHISALKLATENLLSANVDESKKAMVAAFEWSSLIAQGAASPVTASIALNLRIRSSPHIAQALNRSATLESGFFEFSSRLMAEFTLAVHARDEARAHALRQADLLTYQRYLYDRLGWSLA